MKPFLILQLRPEDETADNEYRALLRYGALQQEDVERVRVEQAGVPSVAPDDYAGIIVGGSPFDISTPREKQSDVQRRVVSGFMELMDTVVTHDIPFLGACSGNGLLGLYCGTSISTKYGEPVGGVEVSLTEAGTREPLLAQFPDQFRVMVGHKEACDHTPERAELLITGERCPVQMFRIKQNVFATQFHPEGDADGFKTRVDVYKHHGYFPAEKADELKSALDGEESPWGNEILRRFVARYSV
jgi:GMP synthase (glutamine-hydrolysing)